MLRIGPNASSDEQSAINIRTDTQRIGVQKNPTGEYILDVSGSINCDSIFVGGSEFTGSGGGVWTQDASNNISYSLGNVGIGTTDPSYALDVSGDMRASGDLYTNGDLYADSDLYASGDLYTTDGDLFLTGDISMEGDVLTTGDMVLDGSMVIGKSSFDSSGYALDVSGDVQIVGGVGVSGELTVGGDVSANAFYGDGSNLSGISSGWVGTATSDLDMGAYNITNTGYVGINTSTNTTYALRVNNIGATQISSGGYTAYYIRRNYNSLQSGTGQQIDTAIYALGSIWCTSDVGSLSDARIKKDIVDMSDNEALELLRQIKPKKYKYIDDIGRTNDVVYGYIAQEVKEVIPYAVKTTADFIPNIYELVEVSGNVLNFQSFHTDQLDPSSNTLKLYDYNDKEIIVSIESILGDNAVSINEDLSAADMSNNALFCYGQEVEDLHHLTKERINVVAVSALQELDTQVQTLQAEKDALQTELTDLKSLLQSKGLLD